MLFCKFCEIRNCNISQSNIYYQGNIYRIGQIFSSFLRSRILRKKRTTSITSTINDVRNNHNLNTQRLAYSMTYIYRTTKLSVRNYLNLTVYLILFSINKTPCTIFLLLSIRKVSSPLSNSLSHCLNNYTEFWRNCKRINPS